MNWERYRAGFSLLLSAVIFSTGAYAEFSVSHRPLNSAKSNNRIKMTAMVRNSDGDVADVRASFKAESADRFYYVPMQRGLLNRFSGVLPAPALGVGSVEYMIYAVGAGSINADKKEYVKTERYKILIQDDEEALTRLQGKEPTNIDVNFDRLEETRDFATRSGEPDEELRVEVRTNITSLPYPVEILGFTDYIAMTKGSAAAAGAGIGAATTIATKTGFVAGIASASTPVLIGGAVGTGVLLGAASSGGSSSGGTVFSDPTGDVLNWRSPAVCTGVTDTNYANRWVVALTQSGTSINGNVYFHDCPGLGRVGYSVSGTVPSAGDPILVAGPRTEGQGALFFSAPNTAGFELRTNQPPVCGSWTCVR